MEPLGQGGMATVWLARDLKHDRLVAIKLLRPELAVPVGADRFASEIGIVAKLNHPNILGVLDSGVVQIDGVTAPYYVMPHVEGPSLAALLGRGETLEVNEALRLAAEVADALAFAHSRGVVHRDVKPGNILIQAGHALVADFGVAIALDAATIGGRHTTQGEVLGTPVYMSPEQASGATRVDGRSDIYSLGCVLYEMLSGDPPFTGNTPQAMIVAHLSEPPPPLASKRPGIAPALAAAVHRALEKQPSARYANAGEFRDTLEGLRASITIRRRWWPTAALVVAVAALFWWSPWRKRTSQAGPGSDIVVLLSGFRDRSGTMRAEAAVLDDALRKELQAVPGLRVIDAGDQPEVPVDTLRKRYQADWIIRGTLDEAGDSVGATVRVVNARNGAEVRSGITRQRAAGTLQSAAVALGPESLFGTVRYAIDSLLIDRWWLALGTDSATVDLRRRAEEIRVRSTDALATVGPRRMLEELAIADSLLALAGARSPSSALPPFARTRLGTFTAFATIAARQQFPDSTWLPPPVEALQRALPFAHATVHDAPEAPDSWFARADVYQWLFEETQEPAWRDSALADLRKASTIAVGRPDIWARRAGAEAQAGRWSEALFSAQQGEANDHLHTNAYELLYRRSVAELALGETERALESCRAGARSFPGSAYFLLCESEVLGYTSSDPAAAARLIALADSLTRHGRGDVAAVSLDGLRLLGAAILARAGLPDSASDIYDRTTARWRGLVDPVLLLDAAYARQELGDPDSALAIVARAVRQQPSVAPSVERSRWFLVLRRSPAFPDAVKGIAPSERRRS